MKEEKKEETVEAPKPKNFPFVYVAGIIILILGVGAGLYFMNKSGESQSNAPEEQREEPNIRPTGPGSLKGQQFSNTQLANSAVQIYPGTISASASAVMSGWKLSTKIIPDGTTQVSLIPVGSEATEGDTQHTFILKKGDKLYFDDINPADDTPGGGTDNNKNDDMGIVVDANGIIQ